MHAYPECMTCFVEQTIRASRIAGADARQTEVILRDVLDHLRRADWGWQPPRLAIEVYRIVEDPAELRDVSRSEDDERLREARLAMIEWFHRRKNPDLPIQQTSLSKKDRNRLRALGYID